MTYSDLVRAHFHNPSNVANGAHPGELRGRAGDRRRGAIVEFRGWVTGGKITRLNFRAWGCPVTIAVASWLTCELPGKAVAGLLPLHLESTASALGVPAEKWHCILIAEDALREMLEDWLS